MNTTSDQPQPRFPAGCAGLCNPRPRLAVAALLLLGVALCLPGVRRVPVTDRDEARYAQASKQMVETGDYVQIRFLEEARNKKPAGIYWLHTLSVRLTGVKDEIWPYRLVSVGGALLLVLLTYALARRLHPGAPLLPAAVLAACPLLVVVSHAATTDAVMSATVCAAQLCLAVVYLGARCPVPGATDPRPPSGRASLLAALGFWVALGVGILVKGPIPPLIAALTIVALCVHDRDVRWLRALRPALGVPLLLLLVLPWLVAIQRKTSFLQDSVGKDFLTKVQGAQESHGAPPGMYLALTALLFWPLAPRAWRGIGHAWQARRTDPTACFLLAWLLPAWVVFELVPTKLPHYVLPLYPALALLAVRGWGATTAVAGPPAPGEGDRIGAGGPPPVAASAGARIWRFTCLVADIAWWIGAAAFVLGPILAARLLGWQWMPAAFAAAAVAALATVLLWRLRRRPAAAVVSAAFALGFFPLLFLCVAPRLDDLWLTRKVQDMVVRETGGKPAQVVSVGYGEPSVAFTFGTRTVLTGGVERAVQMLRQDPAACVLIQDLPAPPPRILPVDAKTWERWTAALSVAPKQRHRDRFLAAAAQAGIRVREVAFVDGLNYSRTRRARVILYRREDG
jgi:4-amino-4-deoxy-L-arabinose transferase-like glycosyltransferase